jgi:transcription elongation factor Elf1
MCKHNDVFASYEENKRYKYSCNVCGQYFEFNAPSQLAADVIFNQVIAHEQKGGEGDADQT